MRDYIFIVATQRKHIICCLFPDCDGSTLFFVEDAEGEWIVAHEQVMTFPTQKLALTIELVAFI